MAAAHEGKSVKEFLVNLAQARLDELEKRGILPKGTTIMSKRMDIICEQVTTVHVSHVTLSHVLGLSG